jgi:hypothetical protein
MKTIYKYPLRLVDYQRLKLPKHSILLSVQNVRDELVLYALIDDEHTEKDDDLRNLYVIIVGTGRSVFEDNNQFEPEDVLKYKYLGTVIMTDGTGLVWHVFVDSLSHRLHNEF